MTLCGEGGTRDLRAGVLVDCTGDANATALARHELEGGAELQPGTLNIRLSGDDPTGVDYEGPAGGFGMTPVALLVLFAQRRIVSGLTAGSFR